MTLLLEMFTYPFIVRAFAAGVLLSLCAALLGHIRTNLSLCIIFLGFCFVEFAVASSCLVAGLRV